MWAVSIYGADDMTATRYCYHCGKSHPKSEMRQISTKGGTRWRCIQSIKAIKKTAAERDAYGKQISAQNAEAWSTKLKSKTTKVPL
jgi:hypothetical protein